MTIIVSAISSSRLHYLISPSALLAEAVEYANCTTAEG